MKNNNKLIVTPIGEIDKYPLENYNIIWRDKEYKFDNWSQRGNSLILYKAIDDETEEYQEMIQITSENDLLSLNFNGNTLEILEVQNK